MTDFLRFVRVLSSLPRLLRLVSVREARDRLGRVLVITAGVATGVTLIVAIDVINRSVISNVRDTIDTLAGPASLQVTLGIGEIGFDEAILESVRRHESVAAAVPIVRGTVSLIDARHESLQLFGVDLTQERELGRYNIVAVTGRREILRGLEDPRSVLLPRQFANERNLEVGSQLHLATPTGIHIFTVRGLLDAAGAAQAFAGRLVVMDLPAAQLTLGRGNHIDQIDVMTQGDSDLDVLSATIQARLPRGFVVGRPEQRGEAYERIIGSFQALLRGLSSLCLVAGLFIIYNTTSTGAVHRAAALATMRHIGATKLQLVVLLMAEAVLLGLIGSVVGIVQGVGLGRLLANTVTDSMGVIFQLRFVSERIILEPVRLLGVLSIGVSVCVIASWFAARRVASIDPLAVSRGDLSEVFRQRTGRELIAWWVLLVSLSAGALGLQELTRSVAWGNFGSTLWFASSIIIAVPIVSGVSHSLTRWLGGCLGAPGRVAAESIQRSPIRAGVTVAAIALVLTIALSVSTIAESLRSSVNAYFASGFLSSDLVVSATSSSGGWLETPVDQAIVDKLTAVPGVRRVEVLRILPGQLYRGERIALAGTTPGMFEAKRHPPGWYVEGDAEIAASALTAKRGARISISLSERFDLHVGDVLELESPTGTVHLEIVGVVPDYMSDRGGVGVHYDILRERWQDAMVNRVAVFVDEGMDLGEVRSRIEASVGATYALRILSLDEVGEYHEQMIARAFSFTGAIQLLVVIVTVAGILDLLLSAVVERRRELAVWRIVGADDATVARAIVIESVTIGVLGLALGLIVGAVTAWIWVKFNFRHLLGYYLDYSFATEAVLRCSVVTLTMTCVAGWIAARYAIRQPFLDGVHVD